jgi:hypothetical protein
LRGLVSVIADLKPICCFISCPPRSLALCMFGTPDFSDKFPTQQEKLLAFFERIEIG